MPNSTASIHRHPCATAPRTVPAPAATVTARRFATATLLTLAALSQSWVTLAQSLNKCTDTIGNVTYTDQPCAQIKSGPTTERKVATSAPASDALHYKARLAKQTEAVDKRVTERIAAEDARIASLRSGQSAARSRNCAQAQRDYAHGQAWAGSINNAVRHDALQDLKRSTEALASNDCLSSNELFDARRGAAQRFDSVGAEVPFSLRGR